MVVFFDFTVNCRYYPFQLNFLKQFKRQPLALFVDACIVVNSYTLASLVLFSRWAPLQYYNELLVFLPIAITVHLLVNYRIGLYRGIGRYAGINQGLKIVRASIIAVALLLVAGMLVMPSSRIHALAMVPIGGAIVFILTAGVRFYPRVFYERSLREVTATMHLLIVGAGEASEMIVRSIQKERLSAMDVVALVDDDTSLQGQEIHGVPIYTSTDLIGHLVHDKSVDEILIAIPSASLEDFQRIWRLCDATGLPVKTLRPLQSTQLGRVGVSDIREVEIEDVLGRQPVKTDYTQISRFINGETVLISGAGGSIGSELALQICQHGPRRLVLVDQDESALYNIHEKLSQMYFQGHDLYVADIRNEEKLDSIFSKHRPGLVFHAAAYKHVPLMELHPDEAILNNVRGTYNIARAAGEHHSRCFVNISTDKAVEPANVMGATKYLSERIVSDLGMLHHETKYCSVRFGNVLGSRGSVIPIFRRQILEGGPVTVTHPEMSRYFMLISEAVDLVLQAASFEGRNVVYALEMGKPVRVVDLANQMIELMNPPEPVEIVFTGLRPGEKIHELLVDKCETRMDSDHPMIYRVRYPVGSMQPVLDMLPTLWLYAEKMDNDSIRGALEQWIPSYHPFDMRQVGSLAATAAADDGPAGDAGVHHRHMTGDMNYSWSSAEDQEADS